MTAQPPTPVPELNAVLDELVAGIRAILGDAFIGAYMHGSFASGGWDAYSDVDFIVAIARELTEAEQAALQALHERLYQLDSPWAQSLEGSYIPIDTLRRVDRAGTPVFYFDNGVIEPIWSDHDNTLVVRWQVREHSLTLAGPDPRELIDPVPAGALRREVLETMHEWAGQLFAEPERMNNRWYQPFALLSYCRMLHTLETGRVGSKPEGAAWALRALDPRWRGLIERALAERPDQHLKVHQEADPDDLAATREFIRYALALSERARDGSR